MTKVEKAMLFATLYHDGQRDKAGVKYILHPMYVAGKFTSRNKKIVALLHDTVEDTGATLDQIELLFGNRIRRAVDAITRRKGEPYEEYILRVKKDRLAKAVKIEDLKHNMMNRIPNMTVYDAYRMEKYRKAYCVLTGEEYGTEHGVA
jgi:(p)ppGpp synthase/HD superfamily hydrolase